MSFTLSSEDCMQVNIYAKPYQIKVELTNKDCMPTYSSEEAAGLDMRANIFDRAGYIVVPAG